jgi:sterol desaturase/sphingolipid hydroxylase (fatty acid hydroxylase superfamily)
VAALGGARRRRGTTFRAAARPSEEGGAQPPRTEKERPMSLETIVLAAYLATFAILALLDVVAPARPLPRVRWWRTKGIVFFGVSTAVSIVAPLGVGRLLPAGPLVDLSGLGVAAGTIVALLGYQLAVYAWHRAMHRVPLLWRSHQLHHSAERVDVFGAMMFHPLDLVGFTLATSAVFGVFVGVPAEALLLAGGFSSLLSLFQHANLRTPAWLGWIVQRPEGHGLHHERGVHAYNYGDLAIWDVVFGTFRNPRAWDGEAGFYDGASARVGEMLVGRLVDVPRAADGEARRAVEIAA